MHPRALLTIAIGRASRHPLSELLVPILRLLWRVPVEHFSASPTVRELFVRFPSNIDTYRPIDGDAEILAPCDGIAALVRRPTDRVKDSTRLVDCALPTSRAAVRIALLPHHFHHVFSPVDGTLISIRAYDGALRFDPSKRVMTNRRVALEIVDHSRGARFFLVLIGAIGVGVIRLTTTSGARLHRGDHVGFFDVGGSCVVLSLPRAMRVIEGGCVARRALARPEHTGVPPRVAGRRTAPRAPSSS